MDGLCTALWNNCKGHGSCHRVKSDETGTRTSSRHWSFALRGIKNCVGVCVCMELYQCCSVASCPSCLLLSSGQKLSRQQCRTKIVCVCVCVWNCTSGVASLAAHLAYCSVARQKLSRQQWRTSVALLVAATIATNLLT